MAFYIQTDCTDPYRNLALEAMLGRLAAVTGEPVLYLWQNAPCVVIGINQNPWLECNISAMEADGVLLVRRRTGGGAVYHDDGNLNYSICLPEAMFDEARQYGVVLRALESLTIPAIRNGRNDILADGKKISGSAFSHSQGAAIQHGTLLLQSRLEVFGRYLTPDREKFTAKGVTSVSSRVGNLEDLRPELTFDDIRHALRNAFEAEYGGYSPMPEITEEQLESEAEAFRSWSFRYGRTPEFERILSHRFPFGHIRIGMAIRQGAAVDVQADSDLLDVMLPPALANVLEGKRYGADSFAAAARSLGGPESEQIADWLADEQLYS